MAVRLRTVYTRNRFEYAGFPADANGDTTPSLRAQTRDRSRGSEGRQHTIVTFGIRARLLAAFFAVALFTGALGLYAVSTMERMSEDQRTVYGDVFGGTTLLATWVDTSWQAREELQNLLLTDDPATVATRRRAMQQTDQELTTLAQQIDAADTDREDVLTLAALVLAWDNYKEWRDQAVLGPLEQGDREAALQAWSRDGQRLGAAVDQAIDAFLEKKREVGGHLELEAENSFDLTRHIAILLSIAAVGLGLGVGFFQSRSIARGVEQVAHAAEGLAVGDLNQQIAITSRDEIGSMAAAVREMIAYQQEMARVAEAIARGDLTQNVSPKGRTDQLGSAFQHMIGNLRTLVGQLEDAVKRAKQLADIAEERGARMRAVLDSVADAIITFEENGKIDSVNPTAERIFGVAANTMVGTDFAALLGDNPKYALAVGSHHELVGRRSDGTPFPIELAVSDMRVADRRLLIASIRDITERKQADAKFRGLLESAPDAIVTVNREGRIALVNTQAELLLGYDRSELLGEMVEILLPEQLREIHRHHRPQYLKAPTTRKMGGSIELTARRKDGSEFPAEISLSPLQSEDGILTTSVIRDITERKRAEEAQRFLTEASTLLASSLDYETTLTSVAQLAVPVLADGCIVEVVKDGEDAAGLTAVALVKPEGANLAEILGELSEHVLHTGRTLVWSGDVTQGISGDQLDQIRAAGLRAVMVVPLVVGRSRLGVISFVAARAGRDYGPKGVSLAEELAHRCALAIENARLYREAQRAVGLRDDFFSVASHELKTPVAALLAYTQFILNRAQRQNGLSAEQISDALDEVHWQADRIARLVAQLLDTSRLDAGKFALELEPTELTDLVRDAVYTAHASNSREVRLHNNGPIWALVDPVRVEQVIVNLVDNAIKYSPDGGPVEVELLQADPQNVSLVVTDHGIGIPPEHRAHVFDRFYQAHAGRHFAGVAGMGLGLYITRRIVEMHGGIIRIDGAEGGGARVTVTLPTRADELETAFANARGDGAVAAG
jgi:PAS domain S-box-containing protein